MGVEEQERNNEVPSLDRSLEDSLDVDTEVKNDWHGASISSPAAIHVRPGL